MSYEEELDRRLALLDHLEHQGQGFDLVSVLWLAIGCVIIPALLLAWGW